ncbi:MAG: PEP-CTERM sorting domain-containing protein [Planctomycetota bacterium]|nr:PEP-CTERM sorting domain-containing protein [Planctomycetota bacterium]
MQSGSTLAVLLIDGFVPQGDEVFDILDFGGRSGEFSTLSLPDLGSGLSWDTSDLYTSGTITVVPEPATLALVLVGAAATVLRRRPK